MFLIEAVTPGGSRFQVVFHWSIAIETTKMLLLMRGRKKKKRILPVSTFRCIYVRIKSFINSTLNRCFSWWSHRTSHAVGLKSQPCWLEALIAFLGIQAAFKKRSSDKKILTFPSGFLFLMFIKRMPSHLLIFLLLPLPRRYFAITRCVSWNKSM